MQIIKCKNQEAGAMLASRWLEDAIAATGAERIFIPAGNTPISLYQLWEATNPEYLQNKVFVQVDDIVTGEQKGRFRDFFAAHLKSYVSQVEWIDEDDTGADIAILGLGTNGHVAFHEPQLEPGFEFGCVKLCDDTCQRLEAEEGSWGITFGIGKFLHCKRILLLVYGESKRDALTAVLQRNPAFPASALMDHPGLTIFSDLVVAT
jgi:6-phosphogluconolactonase/glucosamine-6-phosphate isomerase/deaminase